MNGPNKLEFYITQGTKDLQDINTLAYWAHWQVAKKTKCCVSDSSYKTFYRHNLRMFVIS
jgi:hypothetical protein